MARFLTASAFLSCLACSTVLCQDVCYEKADVLFVIDASSSVGPTDFQKQLQFAATLVNNFQVGVTQFSVLKFDSAPETVIDFDDYKDNSALKNAILNVAYTGGGTDTAAALKLARTDALPSARGARTVVPKIIIVSTDGQSNSPNDTVIEAQNLKNPNVLVLAIGVGSSYYKPELNAIATFTEDVFEVVDYTRLVAIVNDYSNLVCQTVKLFNCNEKSDVFFLLDSSSSITQELYQNELLLISNISMNADLREMSIGAATFGGSTVQRLFNLGQYIYQFQLSQALASAIYLGGHTDTDSALKSVVSQNVFDPTSGGRADATKILIIVTDGGSTTAAQAKLTSTQLRTSGVNMIAVGVSKPNLSELKDLVSHSVLDVVTNIANYKVAADRVETLAAVQKCEIPNMIEQDYPSFCKQNFLDNGIHAHPFDCTKFIECTFLKTDIMSCPPNEVYDPIIQTCIYPGQANPCGDINSPKSTPRPPTTSSSTDIFICNGNQYDDVIFVLDSSASITTDDYQKQLAFVADVTSRFTLGTSDVHFGVVVFSQETVKLFDLKDFTRPEQLRSAIMSAPHLKSGTDTAKALNFVREQQMFSRNAGGRDNSTKIVIVLTDGRSNSLTDTANAAQQLRASRVKLIVVGIGEDIFLDELRALASDQEIPRDPENVMYDYNLCLSNKWVDGKHPNPADCSTYVQCNSLYTDVLYCPSGEAYDPIDEICKHKSLAHSCSDSAYFGAHVTLLPNNVESTKTPIIVG